MSKLCTKTYFLTQPRARTYPVNSQTCSFAAKPPAGQNLRKCLHNPMHSIVAVGKPQRRLKQYQSVVKRVGTSNWSAPGNINGTKIRQLCSLFSRLSALDPRSHPPRTDMNWSHLQAGHKVCPYAFARQGPSRGGNELIESHCPGESEPGPSKKIVPSMLPKSQAWHPRLTRAHSATAKWCKDHDCRGLRIGEA